MTRKITFGARAADQSDHQSEHKGPWPDKRSDERHQSISDFFLDEFVGGVGQIHDALILDGWFGRTTSSVSSMSRTLGWESPGGERSLGDERQRAERDHPQELDFDR